MLKIKDKIANINIDISSVYRIEINENNSMLVIYLDNGIDIRIEKQGEKKASARARKFQVI